MKPNDTDYDRSTVTRRRVLAAAGGATLAGLAVLESGSRRTRAEVSMGEFSVSGDSATVDGPPAAITITASGEFEIQAPEPPEKVEQTLQVRLGGGDSDDLARDAAFDTASGSFDFSTGLYSHQAVERGDLTPTSAGQTRETDLRVRVIVGASRGGELIAESYVEETATLSITQEAIEVSIGGSASVSIEE
jgi:hypothetical protein